jgi:hypothetical protein
MIDDRTVPVPISADAGGWVSTIARLAEISEEEIWLQKRKSARTRRGLPARRPALHAHARYRHGRGTAAGRPQGGDRLGAHHARERARGGLDDPPAPRGAILALQAPGAARPRRAQPDRRGCAAGDQSRRGVHPCLLDGAGAQDARCAADRDIEGRVAHRGLVYAAAPSRDPVRRHGPIGRMHEYRRLVPGSPRRKGLLE